MKIITCISLKGGTGKTATALNTGAALARMGNRVLFVDLDTQNSLTDTMNGPEEGTLPDFLKNPDKHFFIPCDYGHIVNRGTDPAEPADLRALSEGLAKIQKSFDYVVIDTPPALSESTVSAIFAADGLIIPAKPDPYSLRSVSRLFGALDELREAEQIRPDVFGILLTMYNDRRTLDRQTAEQFRKLAKRSGTKVFDTTIRNSVVMPESSAMNQSVFEYQDRTPIAADLRAFTAELLETINGRKTSK